MFEILPEATEGQDVQKSLANVSIDWKARILEKLLWKK
jgi:hypothetical protein